MTVLLLCIIFSDLTFKGLTIPILAGWFCGHPFLFIAMMLEFFITVKHAR